MFFSRDIGASAPAGDDDYWYTPVGRVTAAGARVSPATAMRSSAVYACIKVLSESVAQLPLFLYNQDSKGIKTRATSDPTYLLLHKRPNRWQTSFEWREMMQGHASLRGNAYSEMIFAPNGQVLELIPRHPDRIKIELTPADGLFRYIYNDPHHGDRRIPREAMFHLRGQSNDGFIGMSPIEIEAETIGMALSVQDYGARFFANDARPGGVVEFAGKFKDDDARRKFRSNWQAAQTGSGRHKVAVLEHGMTFKEVGMKNKDAQFLDTRKYTDTDIARIFRIPPHKIGNLEKATFSNIEQQSIEFVTDTIVPWLVRWEQALDRALIIDEQQIVEFLVDGLLRGDSASRAAFYNSSITTGWLTRNEARVKENMQPLPGLDEPLQQLNMGQGGRNNGGNRNSDARQARLIENGALRIANKEEAAFSKIYDKALPHKEPLEAFTKGLDRFCKGHAKYIAAVLQVPIEGANVMVEEGRRQILNAVNDEIEKGEQVVPDVLATWVAARFDYLTFMGE